MNLQDSIDDNGEDLLKTLKAAAEDLLTTHDDIITDDHCDDIVL